MGPDKRKSHLERPNWSEATDSMKHVRHEKEKRKKYVTAQLKSVLWIQKHWIWIRITNRIQGFWPNLDPDFNFERKYKNLKKNNFLYKIIFLRTKCHLKKFLVSWITELLFYILKLAPFVSILSYYMCGSGSVFRIQSSWIRIRFWIHNTGWNIGTGTSIHLFLTVNHKVPGISTWGEEVSPFLVTLWRSFSSSRAKVSCNRRI